MCLVFFCFLSYLRYNAKSSIVKATEFSKRAVYGTSYNESYTDPNYYGTHLVTVNSSDIGVPLRAPFDSITNPESEFKVKVVHDVDGMAYVYVNDKLAMQADIGVNNGGGVGLFAGCNAGFHSVQIYSKSEKMELINGLCVNPNGGTYDGNNDIRLYAGKTGTQMSLKTPTREGYKFVGWATDDTFNGEIVDNIYKFPDFESIDVIVAR